MADHQYASHVLTTLRLRKSSQQTHLTQILIHPSVIQTFLLEEMMMTLSDCPSKMKSFFVLWIRRFLKMLKGFGKPLYLSVLQGEDFRIIEPKPFRELNPWISPFEKMMRRKIISWSSCEKSLRTTMLRLPLL